MTDADDFEEREQRTRAFLTDKIQRAIKLRSKDREFHGSGLLEVMVTVLLTQSLVSQRRIGGWRRE